MMLTFMFLSLILFSLTFPFLNNLLSMGASLFLMSFNCTLILSYLMGSWFGLILFLIYITGLLVLFGYMLAMNSNTMYLKSTPPKWYTLLTTITIFAAMLWLSKPLTGSSLNLNNEWSTGVVHILSGNNMLIYWAMALILFLVLIITVTLCYKSPKPLRAFFSMP